MPSLLEQLAAAEWMADWPEWPVPTHPTRPLPGLPALLAARGAVDAKDAVPAEQVRLAIAQLHEWNRAAEPWLTVPPTLLGFARAMDRLKGNSNTALAAASALIEAAWPDLVGQANAVALLDKAQVSPARPPQHGHAAGATSSEKGARPPRKDPPARPAMSGQRPPPPAGTGSAPHPERPPASTASTPAAAASDSAKSVHATAPRKPSAGSLATAESLMAQAMEDADAPLAVRAERFGTFIKEKVVARTGKTWFEDILVPALAAIQDKEQLRELARVWPRDLAFSPPDPVGWVKGPALWGPLRAASPEVRDTLMENWLPWLVDSSGWTPSQRFAAFKCMVGWVKTDAALLDQRVALWKAWGGRPEEKCGEWGREENAFVGTDGGNGKELSAIEWMAAQDVPLWKAWAERAATPQAQAPAPARHRPSP